MNEFLHDKPFERMLKAKIRSPIEERGTKATEEREMLSTFLSQLSKRAVYRRPEIIEKEPKALTRFPMKIFGEVFFPGDGVTAVIGDVEIPKGAVVDRSLVVKGKLRIGAKCRILKKMRALGGISIAGRCLVKASLESGGIIELGKDTTVEGDVHSQSFIKLSQGARIYGFVDAEGAYTS